MIVVDYIKKCVKIELSNGYYYRGLVLSADDNSLTLRDKNNNLVTLNLNSITAIQEVS